MLSEEEKQRLEKQLLTEAHCLVETSNRLDVICDRLFAHYRERIYKLCMRVLERHEDAEDATQQTFLNARSNVARFRGEAQFYTWLCRIANNHCINILKGRRNRLNQNTTSYDQSPMPDVVDSNVPPLEDEVVGPISAQQLLTAILAKAANKWKVLDYQLFILRTLPSKTTAELNMTYPEMAILLEKNENTLKWRWNSHVKPVLNAVCKHELE